MRILILGLLSFLIMGHLAWGDDDNQTLTDLGDLIIGASRSNDTVGDMNKDVSVITSDQIAASPAKDLAGLLNDVAGVDVREFGGIKDEQINLGDFGEASPQNVLVLVDGRRVNSPDLLGADLSTIDLNTIDHIEIIQGSGTVLYGDNSDGGVINIVTKKGTADTKPSVTLFSEVDSYKGNKDGFNLSGGLPQLAYEFDYDRQQTNNYRTDNNYWGNNFHTQLNYNPTDIFGIDFEQGYHVDRYRLPGGISIADIDMVGLTGVNPVQISDGTTSDSYFNVTPHLKLEEGTSTIDLSLLTSSRKYLTDTFYPNYPQVINYEEESYEFQPKAIISTPLTDRLDNKLTTGYDYIYYTEKRRSIPGLTDAEDDDYATEASDAAYLLDELTLDQRWLLNTGVRGAWAQYVFNQNAQGNPKLDRSDTTEGYDGGLGYKYNPNSKVFVDYSHTYRLPDLDEYFQVPAPYYNMYGINPGLTYQTGNQYQLGVKDNTIKDLHLGFTATEVQYKNEIYYNPYDFSNENYGGRTRHISEEADATVDLFNKKIQPFVNVTFQQAHFISGEFSGNEIPFVPDHLASAGITFNPLEGLSTAISTHFTDKAYLISDQQNTEPQMKRYDTVDWQAKYDFSGVELWVAVLNIFDKHYYTYGVTGGPGDDVYYPAPGRNVAAGVKVPF